METEVNTRLKFLNGEKASPEQIQGLWRETSKKQYCDNLGRKTDKLSDVLH